MKNRYIVGILDKYSGENKLEIIEASDKIAALFGVVYGRKPEIRHIASKLLLDYPTTEELIKYFLDYWGLCLTEPYRLYN